MKCNLCKKPMGKPDTGPMPWVQNEKGDFVQVKLSGKRYHSFCFYAKFVYDSDLI